MRPAHHKFKKVLSKITLKYKTSQFLSTKKAKLSLKVDFFMIFNATMNKLKMYDGLYIKK